MLYEHLTDVFYFSTTAHLKDEVSNRLRIYEKQEYELVAMQVVLDLCLMIYKRPAQKGEEDALSNGQNKDLKATAMP